MTRNYVLPLQLAAVVLFVLTLGHLLDVQMITFFYTLSTIFKELLSLLLPFIISSFVISGMLNLKKNAPVILSLLMLCIFISNMIVAFLSYLSVLFVLPADVCPVGLQALHIESGIVPYVSFAIPHLISPQLVLLFSILIGMYLSWYRSERIEHIVINSKQWVEWILLRFFIPLLPVYVFGYLLEIQSRGILKELLVHYGNAILLILCLQLSVIALFYIMATSSFKKGWQALKNALPSYITALSTMSSTATIPVTAECAEKNTGNSSLADIAVPIMANVHLTGASINIPVLSLATLLLFKSMVPTPTEYVGFAFYFCTSMFAVTGIPGGGLIVMMPLLIDYFQFTPSMISVLTALYLLLDAFGTATNVMGDGALIIVLNRFLRYIGIYK